MDSALNQIAEKCGNQLRAYRTFSPRFACVLAKDTDGDRELCFGESGGLGEEMSGGETGTFRLFRGEVCARLFWGEGLMVVFRC